MQGIHMEELEQLHVRHKSKVILSGGLICGEDDATFLFYKRPLKCRTATT